MMWSLLMLLLIAQPDAPAGAGEVVESAPAAEVAPVGDEAQAAPLGARVQLVHLRASGAVTSAAGVKVAVERSRRLPGAPVEITGMWEAESDARGLVSFGELPPLGIAERDEVVVLWQEREVREEAQLMGDPSGRPHVIIVHDGTDSQEDLSMLLTVDMMAIDRGIRLSHEFRLMNDAHTVVMAVDGREVVLPILTPAPQGMPLTHLLPTRPEPMEFQVSVRPPVGGVVIRQGQPIYRGEIPPEGVEVSIDYDMPYHGLTEHLLGFQTPVRTREVTLAMRGSERAFPAVSFRDRSESFIRKVQGGHARVAFLSEELAPGEVVLVDVHQTPDRHSFVRPLSTGLALVLVAVLLVMALAEGPLKPVESHPWQHAVKGRGKRGRRASPKNKKE